MNKKFSAENLVGVERSIQIFNKKHYLIQEIGIEIHLDDLLKFIRPKKDDPFLYGFYKLNNKQINAILPDANDVVELDFNNYNYFLTCFGLYKQ